MGAPTDTRRYYGFTWVSIIVFSSRPKCSTDHCNCTFLGYFFCASISNMALLKDTEKDSMSFNFQLSLKASVKISILFGSVNFNSFISLPPHFSLTINIISDAQQHPYTSLTTNHQIELLYEAAQVSLLTSKIHCGGMVFCDICWVRKRMFKQVSNMHSISHTQTVRCEESFYLFGSLSYCFS